MNSFHVSSVYLPQCMLFACFLLLNLRFPYIFYIYIFVRHVIWKYCPASKSVACFSHNFNKVFHRANILTVDEVRFTNFFLLWVMQLVSSLEFHNTVGPSCRNFLPYCFLMFCSFSFHVKSMTHFFKFLLFYLFLIFT